MIYKLGDPELSKMKPKDAVGNTIGDIEVLARAGSGRVKLRCLLCDGKFETQWHKIKTGHTTSCGCKHKLKNLKQYIGQTFNELTVLNICVKKDTDGAVLTKFQCSCGDTTVKRLNNVMRGKIRSCGHLGKSMGGLTVGENGRIYDIWRQMMMRCYKSGLLTSDIKRFKFLSGGKEHIRYKDYGARGISVCKEWHDPIKFIKWYMRNIRPGESMDRIDNDGNYDPRNMRSGSGSQQSRNQRLRRDNTSGYKGIRWTGYSYRWSVKHLCKEHGSEGCDTIDQALLERNLYIIGTNKPHIIQVPYVPHKIKIISNDNWYTLIIQYRKKNLPTVSSKTSLEGVSGHRIMKEVVNRMKQAWSDKYNM